MSISSCLAWAVAALLILSPSLTFSVSAQTPPTSVTLTFYNDAGEPIEGATQTVPRASCVNLDTSLLPDGYTSVVASVPQAALNLYPSPYCPFLSKSSVGFWNNTDVVLNTLSVRYEGLAPVTTAPGTLSDTQFPPNMYVQPKIQDPEDGTGSNPDDWALNPEKGKLLVYIVAGVLGIGVSIGLYLVYQAAQYKPPPKKKKEKKFKGLQTKKVKKKDAYFIKPAKVDANTTPLLDGMTPPRTPDHLTNKTSKSTEALLVSSSTTSSFSSPVSRGSMQERRTHEVPVLIDMQETNLGNKSSSNTISSQNNPPPRRGTGGSGPVPTATAHSGVKPSTTITTSTLTPPPPPPKSNGNNSARTLLNVSAPSTSSPLATSSSNADLIQFAPAMTQLYQLRPSSQQQPHPHPQPQQQQQQQRSSSQPLPNQYPPPPHSLQNHQSRSGFPQLQQRPQRPQITAQYQPPPMSSQSPPTSPTGHGGGGPRGTRGRGGYGPPGREGYSGSGGGYGQRPPPQSYQGQQGRPMSPPRALSPSGPTSPTRGRGSNEVLVPLRPIHNSNSGYVLPPPSANPGIQQQYRQQQQPQPRPSDSFLSR
ncbi:hypothetical protein BGZ59_002238 [Podila verticillata]|nr:hypothetical protein BGZ59_002238 [Podila verticillata]KFH71894.1 hypothetical protein MVEG_02188 [Podila verticillata NRRL 6337]